MRDGGRELPDVGLGDDSVACEGAVGIDAEDADVLADVGLPVRHCRHLPQATCISALTRSPSLTVETPRPAGNHSGKLVAGNERRMDAALGPWIPVEDVQVGSADAGCLDTDQHFTGAGRGNRTSRSSMPGAALALTTACMVVGMAVKPP